MARPQPSLRFADGGSFITRWAEKARPQNLPNQGGEGGGLGKDAVMAAIARQQREAAAPPPAPPSAPKVDFLRNPGGVLKGRMQAAGLELQDGGHVPGTGEGDKIPAKYEPGEFVVSNDMIDDNPGLREQLSGLRAETLAERGKTVEGADAKATRHKGSLRAADGWDPIDRMQRGLTGQNTLPPRSPVGNMAQDLTQNARPPFDPNRNFAAPNNGLPPGPSSSTVHGAPAPVNAPTNGLPPGPASQYPRSISAPTGGLPPGMSSNLAGGPAAAAAEALHGERVNPTLRPNDAAFHGDGRYGAPAADMPAAPAATAVPEAPGRLRSALNTTKAVGSGALSLGAGIGAGLGGAAAVTASRDIGAPGAPVTPGPATDLDRRVAQIPTDGYPKAPAAQPYDFFKDNEIGRNIGNTLNAVAPLQTVGAVARGATEVGAAARAGVASRAGRAAVGAAGLADDAVLGASAALQTGAGTGTRPSARDPNAQAGAAETAGTGAPGPGGVRRIDRPGQSPLFTNTPDGGQFGNDTLMARGPISAQNEAAANTLAARETLRGQQSMGSSQYDREVQQAQAANAMQQRLYGRPEGTIQNGLMSRTPDQQRRDAAVSASSIHGRTAEGGRAELKALDQKAQDGLRADTARYAADQHLEGTKYASDNSLRGTTAQANAVGGATRATAQAKAQQQAMYGQIFRQAGGDPVAAERMAASYGLDPQQFTGMASAAQTRGAANDKSTRAVFGGMFGKDGEQQEAQAHHMAQQMFPDWNRMSPEKQAEASTEVVQATKALQSMNAQRNSGWSKKLGFDAPSPEMSQLPDMTGATVGSVGAVQGWTTPGVSRGDTKITLRNGTERYLKPEEMTEQQLRIFQNRGAKPAKD